MGVKSLRRTVVYCQVFLRRRLVLLRRVCQNGVLCRVFCCVSSVYLVPPFPLFLLQILNFSFIKFQALNSVLKFRII